MITIFLGAAGDLLVLRADLRLTAALYAIAGIGIFVFWAAWKVLVPSFGPSLSNVSAFGLLRNFLFSLSLTAGPHFFRVFDQLPSILTSPGDRSIALAVALAFLVVGLICLQGANGWIGRTSSPNPSDRIAQWYPLVLAGRDCGVFHPCLCPGLSLVHFAEAHLSAERRGGGRRGMGGLAPRRDARTAMGSAAGARRGAGGVAGGMWSDIFFRGRSYWRKSGTGSGAIRPAGRCMRSSSRTRASRPRPR